MRYILGIIFVLIVHIALAQPIPVPPPPDPGAPVPLMGFEYLLAAGALLGINKLRKNLKEKN